MEIINVRVSRSVWLVDTRDLNPRGLNLWPILAAVQDRYRFRDHPKTAEDIDPNNPKGIVFANGSFARENKHYTVAKFTVHTDGLVADTGLSTDLSDAFLEDLLTFVSTQFGLTYRPEMIHSKKYASELIVRMDKSMDRLFVPLSEVINKLGTIVGQPFHPFAFNLSVDHKNTVRPAHFQFERELNKPFDQHRYYSLAPVRTKDHEDLLADLEKAF